MDIDGIEEKGYSVQRFYFLFLQKGDAVLDYRIANEFYKGCKLVIEEG